ncbi:hypothetical protein IC582_010959 [Cucumis melo]
MLHRFSTFSQSRYHLLRSPTSVAVPIPCLTCSQPYNFPLSPIAMHTTLLLLNSCRHYPITRSLKFGFKLIHFTSTMNKDCIKLRDRFSKEYIDGVVQFVEAAKHHVNREGQTRCPCKNSHNAMFQTLASLVDHGLVDDILREQPTTENDDNELFKLLNDLQGPKKEGAYGEDEKDFRNEMHENTGQWIEVP